MKPWLFQTILKYQQPALFRKEKWEEQKQSQNAGKLLWGYYCF